MNTLSFHTPDIKREGLVMCCQVLLHSTKLHFLATVSQKQKETQWLSCTHGSPSLLTHLCSWITSSFDPLLESYFIKNTACRQTYYECTLTHRPIDRDTQMCVYPCGLPLISSSFLYLGGSVSQLHSVQVYCEFLNYLSSWNLQILVVFQVFVFKRIRWRDASAVKTM